MGLFAAQEFGSLEDLYLAQLKDLYDAENRLLKALPKMAKAAQAVELRSAFEVHLRETQLQIERLEEVFLQMGEHAEGHTCEAMKGLIAESEEAIAARGDPAVKDAALIAAAQRIEHYEISGYGTARTFAEQLGFRESAELLSETLHEEAHADQLLTQIATKTVNLRAGQSGSAL